MIDRFLLLAFILVMIYSNKIYALDQLLLNKDNETEITADSLLVDQEKKFAEFVGNVVAVQLDTTIKADKMIAYYEQTQEKKTNAIYKIITIGNVWVINKGQLARSRSGEYLAKEQTLELIGDVVVSKDHDVLKGERIVYDLKTGNGRLFSEEKQKSRVKAVFGSKH